MVIKACLMRILENKTNPVPSRIEFFKNIEKECCTVFAKCFSVFMQIDFKTNVKINSINT